MGCDGTLGRCPTSCPASQNGQKNLKPRIRCPAEMAGLPSARKSFLELAIRRVLARLASRCWSNRNKGPRSDKSFRMLERETGFDRRRPAWEAGNSKASPLVYNA